MANMLCNMFDDIRPYRDDEIPAAMRRIADSEYLPEIVRNILPETSLEDFRNTLLSVTDIYGFQEKVMSRVIKRLVDRTVADFTVSGLKHLKNCDQANLFVCNHRDIVMDSMLLQITLFDNEIPTSLITFGSNLMVSQFVIDIGKANKMFKVERKGPDIRKFLAHSALLSEYIRDAVCGGSSVWIAQRNGRTKDGNDATDAGLLKMFSMSAGKDIISSFAELNITPVTVSYQFEPCDILKARELYLSRGGRKYVKSPGEDLNSIITGLMQPKGMVHLAISKPIARDELERLAKDGSHFIRQLARLIDERIYSGYRLFDTNYIAHDIRSGTEQHAAFYTADERACFEDYIENLKGEYGAEWDDVKNLLLGIYANPVDNSAALRS